MTDNFLRRIFARQAKSDSEWNNLKSQAASSVICAAASKMNARKFRLDMVESMLPRDDPDYRFSVRTDGQDLSNPVLRVIRRADDSVLAEWRGSYSTTTWDNIREINFDCPSQGTFPGMSITAAEPGKEEDLDWGCSKYSYEDRKKSFLYALGKAVYIAEQSTPADTRRVSRLRL